MTGKALTLHSLADWRVSAGCIGIALFAGILAGSYYALYLSSFQPGPVLRGGALFPGLSRRPYSIILRKALVVIQFTISITLIVGAAVINSQINFINTRNLGFNPDNMVAIPNIPYPVNRQYEAFKNQLLTSPHIVDVSTCMQEPSKEILDAGGILAEGVENNPESPFLVYASPSADNFIDFMEIEMLAGRKIFSDSQSDSVEAYILNETAVRLLGWKSPEDAVGRRFKWRELNFGTVVGVVRDFNFSTLHKKVKPLVLFDHPAWKFCILMRINPVQTIQAVEFIRNSWENMFPDYPFEFAFIDVLLERQYDNEKKQGEIIGVFSALAIFIACLGLFGLAAYTAERRTKEIGIRKVLGATPSGIVLLLSGEFTIWIGVANVVAWPAGWLIMDRWLQNFAYRIDIGPGIFVFAGILTFSIALLTVIYQALKAARANPVESLRYE